MCLEFTSKANAIGEGIGQGVMEALQLAQDGNWKAWSQATTPKILQ